MSSQTPEKKPLEKWREISAFGLAALAILLRLASDWLSLAPAMRYAYGILQGAILLVAILLIWPRLDLIFLRGGDHKASIKMGLVTVPFGIAAVLAVAYACYGRLDFGPLGDALARIAYNILYPAVEELEFRGFLLGWLLSRKLNPTAAIILAAVVHTLAHPSLIWEKEYVVFLAVPVISAWFGYITVKTRSIWGAYLAHLSFSILNFPVQGKCVE